MFVRRMLTGMRRGNLTQMTVYAGEKSGSIVIVVRNDINASCNSGAPGVRLSPFQTRSG